MNQPWFRKHPPLLKLFCSLKRNGETWPISKKSQCKIYSRQLRDTEGCRHGQKKLEIKAGQAHKHMIKQVSMGSVSLLQFGGFTCSDSLQVSYSSCRCHWSSLCALQAGFGEHCLTSKCITGSQSVQTAAAFTTSPWGQSLCVTGAVYTLVSGTQGKKRAFPEFHQQHWNSSNCFLIVPKPGKEITTRFSFSRSLSSELQVSNVVLQPPWTQKA